MSTYVDATRASNGLSLPSLHSIWSVICFCKKNYPPNVIGLYAAELTDSAFQAYEDSDDLYRAADAASYTRLDFRRVRVSCDMTSSGVIENSIVFWHDNDVAFCNICFLFSSFPMTRQSASQPAGRLLRSRDFARRLAPKRPA